MVVNKMQEEFAPLLDAALTTAGLTLENAGFVKEMLPVLDQFSFEIRHEPLNGEDSLNGRWVDSGTQRRGWLVINCDGSMMLEIDLICSWPGKDEVYAESVSVWGREQQSLAAEINPMQLL